MSGHDEMVQYAHVDESQCLLEFPGQRLVGGRRLGNARRMVMRKHHGGRVMPQRLLNHFSRIDAGLRQRSVKQFFGRDQAVLCIQPQSEKHFMCQPGQVQAKIIAHRTRR